MLLPSAGSGGSLAVLAASAGRRVQAESSGAAGGLWAAPWQDGALLATGHCWPRGTAGV